jgi:TonB family protein
MKVTRSCFAILILSLFASVCCAQVKRLGPDRIEAPETWTIANLLEAAPPDYPEELREQGVVGKVVIKIVIDKAGAVIAATPMEGNEQLANVTIAAVRQWKFRPYNFENKPVEVETTASVIFSKTSPYVTASKPYPRPMEFRVAPGVAEANLIQKVEPRYPLEAQRKHIQGDVILGVRISREGEITGLTIIQGDPILAEEAREAVQQWRYKPYLLNGEPLEVETTVKTSFRM